MRRVDGVFIAFALAGCSAQGAVEIQEVEVRSTIDETRVAIAVANLGRAPAWIHTWPERFVVVPDDDVITIRLDAQPPEEVVPTYLTPVISYERLASVANPLGFNEHTIELTLPAELGPLEHRLRVAEAPRIDIELAWHDKKPGENVSDADAPEPTGIATWTWLAGQ